MALPADSGVEIDVRAIPGRNSCAGVDLGEV